MRRLTSPGIARWADGSPRGAVLALAVGVLTACGRGDESAGARDVTESGAASDVIGRPEGADSIPPHMRDRDPEPPLPPESLPPLTRERGDSGPDSTVKPPERRPIRDIPPLTRPDSGRP